MLLGHAVSSVRVATHSVRSGSTASDPDDYLLDEFFTNPNLDFTEEDFLSEGAPFFEGMRDCRNS